MTHYDTEIIAYNSVIIVTRFADDQQIQLLLNFLEWIIHIIFVLNSIISLFIQLFHFNISNYYTLLI